MSGEGNNISLFSRSGEEGWGDEDNKNMNSKKIKSKRNELYIERDQENYSLYHNPSLYQKIENIIFDLLDKKTKVNLNKVEKKIYQLEKFRRWEDSTLPYLISLLKEHELVDEFMAQLKKSLIRNIYLNYFSDFDQDIK